MAHDINNFVQGVSSARSLAGAPGATLADAAETAAIIEDDLDQLRKLGGRLRALASAGGREASTRLADACADAFAEVDRPLEQMRAESIPAELRVVGTAAAADDGHRLPAGTCVGREPSGRAGQLDCPRAAVRWPRQPPTGPTRPSPGSPVIVEIAAPDAGDLGAISRARLDVVLAESLPELRGDAR